MLDIHSELRCQWICHQNNIFDNNKVKKSNYYVTLIALLILLAIPLDFIDSICFILQIQI